MGYRAFLDAQVLVPARPRDVLLTLADVGLYEPLWSSIVLEEMQRHLPPSVTPDQAARLVAAMNAAFPEASVDWSGFVEVSVRLGVNEKDRHVISAAIVGGADVVVTIDEQLRGELLSSKIIDSQRLPEFIAYAVDVDQPSARTALLDMATRRWGADDERDAEMRLKAYFAKQGWDPSLLDLDVRPRSSSPGW